MKFFHFLYFFFLQKEEEKKKYQRFSKFSLRFFLEHSTISNLTNFQILSIFEFSKTITFSKNFFSKISKNQMNFMRFFDIFEKFKKN